MTPRKTPEKTQMNLLFCDSKPMMLPDDKQRELAMRLSRFVRQTVKTLLAVRCNFIGPHPGTVLG
jgi:hypothetical protein